MPSVVSTEACAPEGRSRTDLDEIVDGVLDAELRGELGADADDGAIRQLLDRRRDLGLLARLHARELVEARGPATTHLSFRGRRIDDGGGSRTDHFWSGS